jgi:RNA polymerase sigma-70 factor (ECF subfamily)
MFEAHHELVWRTLRRRGLGPDAAADATQQAFLIAAERIEDIRQGSERAFLIGTALRLARSFIRRAGRLQLETDMDLRASPTRNPMDDRAAVQLFDLALSRMNPSLAEVFVLYELDGFSSPEIAKLIGVPLGTVASRLRRARVEFRAEAARLEQDLKREEKK